MATAGLFTLFFEIGFAFLVWRPRTRWVMIGMAVILHGLIGLFMGLKTFSFIMLTMNLAFVPPAALHWFLGKVSRGRLGAPEAGDEGATAAPPGQDEHVAAGKAVGSRQ